MNARMDSVHARVRGHLELEEIHSDERGMPETNRNPDSRPQEVHFGGRITRFIENRWLTMPSPGNGLILKHIVEMRGDKEGISMLGSMSTISISCLRDSLLLRTSSAKRYENFCSRNVIPF